MRGKIESCRPPGTPGIRQRDSWDDLTANAKPNPGGPRPSLNPISTASSPSRQGVHATPCRDAACAHGSGESHILHDGRCSVPGTLGQAGLSGFNRQKP